MWEIDYGRIEYWLDSLDKTTIASIFAALELLEEQGPTLGRPLVDTLSATSVSNLKELRPASQGASEVRIIFAFDPRRKAILLFGGDKSKGKNGKARWSGWYKKAIPAAERAFSEHLAILTQEEERNESEAGYGRP